MDEPNSARDLVEQWQAGDEGAAAELHRRYVERLSSLAQEELGRRLARRLGAEDIVQSAFRTFFRRSRDGQFIITHADELWHLLAKITLNKIRKQAGRCSAQRRDVTLEVHEEDADCLQDLLAREPTPEDGAACLDELETALAGVDEQVQHIVRLRLQGYSTREIGTEAGCSHSTVSRALSWIGGHLERRLRN